MKISKQLFKFEQRLGYVFNNKDLLKNALTHSSCKQDHVDNYQRLEFLGDRVLALCIVNYLMHMFPDAQVGELATRVNKVVSGDTCSEVARTIELGKVLIIGDDSLFSGTRNRKSVLADAIEAVIAAIYIDGGLEMTEKIVISLWQNHLNFELEDATVPKSELQELLSSRRLDLPQYTLLEKIGPAHAPEFKIEVRSHSGESAIGTGKSKKEAEQQAALLLLQQLENEND